MMMMAATMIRQLVQFLPALRGWLPLPTSWALYWALQVYKCTWSVHSGLFQPAGQRDHCALQVQCSWALELSKLHCTHHVQWKERLLQWRWMCSVGCALAGSCPCPPAAPAVSHSLTPHRGNPKTLQESVFAPSPTFSSRHLYFSPSKILLKQRKTKIKTGSSLCENHNTLPLLLHQ